MPDAGCRGGAGCWDSGGGVHSVSGRSPGRTGGRSQHFSRFRAAGAASHSSEVPRGSGQPTRSGLSFLPLPGSTPFWPVRSPLCNFGSSAAWARLAALRMRDAGPGPAHCSSSTHRLARRVAEQWLRTGLSWCLRAEGHTGLWISCGHCLHSRKYRPYGTNANGKVLCCNLVSQNKQSFFTRVSQPPAVVAVCFGWSWGVSMRCSEYFAASLVSNHYIPTSTPTPGDSDKQNVPEVC